MENVETDEKMSRRLARISILASAVALVTIAAFIGFMIIGLKKTTEELSAALEKMPENSADAVLASAELGGDSTIAVPVLYYDQTADACVDLYDAGAREALETRQFEWASCGYYNSEVETELIEGLLGEYYLPVAGEGGKLTPNRGVNFGGFSRWFTAVEGVSTAYAGTLNFNYDAATSVISYENEEFYPLTEILSGKDENVNFVEKRQLFTLNLGVPFVVEKSGEEEFEITADDDTWVFVGTKMVLDMGGVHEPVTGRFKITADGEIYAGVVTEDLAYAGVKVDETGIIRIFHADRNSESSVFKVKFTKMTLSVMNTMVAGGGADDDRVEIAYDPADPEGYIAPLGESLTVEPDRVGTLATALIIEMATLGMVGAVAAVMSVRIWKRATVKTAAGGSGVTSAGR